MRLLTAQEVSDLLQVPVARVYELVRLNLLPVVKLGERQIRFNEEKTTRMDRARGMHTHNF